ncbi:MAG: class II fructose-bisphosphatase [Rhodospirillales bacterium]|nr:class II fructose-bisphosphatase [Rhodospirillales bacterium]
MINKTIADRNLALETVRLTEIAAMAASQYMGGGDEKVADQAAVEAMHKGLIGLDFDGTIRIGEGSIDETDKLYVGEKVGTGEGPKMDVAVVSLEGKSIVARGGPYAITVIAMAEDGGFLTVPNIYMEKIAVGPGLPDGLVDLDREPGENLKALSEAKGVPVSDLVVCMLDRPRHGGLIAKIREAGARIRMILDGDVMGVISASHLDTGVDMFLGIGAAPQGVLAAAALRGVNGQMQGRLVIRNNDDRAAAKAVGIEDLDRKYSAKEMAAGDVTFAATGVTHSALLEGVRQTPGGAITHSMVWRSMTGTLRFVEGHHTFNFSDNP